MPSHKTPLKISEGCGEKMELSENPMPSDLLKMFNDIHREVVGRIAEDPERVEGRWFYRLEFPCGCENTVPEDWLRAAE